MTLSNFCIEIYEGQSKSSRPLYLGNDQEQKLCHYFSTYDNLPLSRCTFSNAVPVFLSLQNSHLLSGPQVLINSIYDVIIASKIPATKVSFQTWKQKSKGAKSGEYGG